MGDNHLTTGINNNDNLARVQAVENNTTGSSGKVLSPSLLGITASCTTTATTTTNPTELPMNKQASVAAPSSVTASVNAAIAAAAAASSIAGTTRRKETDIVSHLRRNSSLGVRQDIESSLRVNNNSNSNNRVINSDVAVGGGLTGLAGSGGVANNNGSSNNNNNNIGTANNNNISNNQFANMLLQGQLSREAALSRVAAMNNNSNNNGMIMPFPNGNMLFSPNFAGFGSFGNLAAGYAAFHHQQKPMNFGSPSAMDPFMGGNAAAMYAAVMAGGGGGGAAAAAMTPSPKKKRRPMTLYMDCDTDSLSEYQCLIRQQIELFEADKAEAASSVQGRNKQIVEGQVGIRCRHCSHLSPRERGKGSMYFPTKMDRIYQAAQNLSAFHLCENCKHVPEGVRKKILFLRERKSPAGGGKRYWGEGVRCLGVIEDQSGLRFK
jgi:hypothetical protein